MTEILSILFKNQIVITAIGFALGSFFCFLGKKIYVYYDTNKFNKMMDFVLNFFISVNFDCEFNGIKYESGKNISSKVASHPSYIVLNKIFNLKLSQNMLLYALFLEVKNTATKITIIPTYRDKDVIDKFNTIDKYYIKILKQELPKILTPDVFDGEKLIV